MIRNLFRVSTLVAALALSAACLPGVGGTAQGISVDDLEQQIAIRLSSENDMIIKLNAVTCYDPLGETAGSQSRCSVTDSGGEFWVTATSLGANDGALGFDINFDG